MVVLNIYRFIVNMMISFHKGYVDEFGSKDSSLNSAHLNYVKNRLGFVLDLVMNAPLDLLVHFLDVPPATKLITIPLFRMNKLLCYLFSVRCYEVLLKSAKFRYLHIF